MIKRFVFATLGALLLPLWAFCATEHISTLYVDLTVKRDGRIDIVETIHVLSQGQQIKRGIVREIPTVYHGASGIPYTVDFVLHYVLHNQDGTDYHTDYVSNGIRIFIGNEKTYIDPGYHTYTIAYSTNRQIGYFDDHDELFWNVTGNGWRLPIIQARFTIHLPPEIPTDMLQMIGYTGYNGDRGTDYSMQVDSDGTITGTTTRALQPHQGLSIALGWPKGYMTQPTWLTTLYYFVSDNAILLILFILLLFLLFMYIGIWICALPLRKNGTIIPLFYPPKNLCPARMACIDSMKYTHKALTAAIVHLAVQGVLKIEYKQTKRLLSSESYYILHKLVDIDSPMVHQLPYHERKLFNELFAEGNSCKFDGSRTSVMSSIQTLSESLERTMRLQGLFDDHEELRATLYLLSVFASVCVFVIGVCVTRYMWIMNFWFWIFVPALIAIHVWGMWLIKHYSVHGRALQDQVEGFKLFLCTTEQHRMQVIGTPPEQTPQLYETYLPYAIALGVEGQWTKKFETIFIQMQTVGNPYLPLWYVGHFTYYPGVHAHMIRTLNSSVTSTIAAGSRPGTQSVFGKGGGGLGGGAGRGSGGGGGGGW